MRKQQELLEFRAFVRSLQCAICKCLPPVDGHHVKSRGSGGIDERNIIPVCRICHSKIHSYGKKRVEDMLVIDLQQIADQVWGLWLQQ
jgi:hypothetical protein